MSAVLFDSQFVVFACCCCVRCFVCTVFCLHVVMFGFGALLCSCLVRPQVVVFAVLFKTDVVFDVMFAPEMLCSLSCLLCLTFCSLFDVCSWTLFCSRLYSDEEVNVVFDVR